MEEKQARVRANGWALVPFGIFVAVYLSAGLILHFKGVDSAFYQFPAPVAVIIGIIFAFIMTEGSLDEKFLTFVKGCGNQDIIIMCIIYLLAGAFSSVASAMGGIKSTVNLGLTFIPARYITAGIFLISSFISIATGTSVGTIVAVGPIAIGFAEKAGLNLALMIATTVGGAMFGDNLSVISDTTIAATRTQKVDMRDKFRVNVSVALPAALITFILLLVFARPETIVEVRQQDYNFIKILPYIFVLLAALKGFNVFVLLTGGIIFAGTIGLIYKDFTLLGLAQEVYSGFENMFGIFLLSMLTGGLAEMVKKSGGIQWILDKVSGVIRGDKTAQLGIAALVSLADIATANNTVAIIIAGPVAKEISNKYRIDPRKSASLLDAFSCVFQGIIPYGAQLLAAVGFANGAVNMFQVMPLLWYQQILALFLLLSIFTPLFNGYIRKNPWDFEESKLKNN